MMMREWWWLVHGCTRGGRDVLKGDDGVGESRDGAASAIAGGAILGALSASVEFVNSRSYSGSHNQRDPSFDQC